MSKETTLGDLLQEIKKAKEELVDQKRSITEEEFNKMPVRLRESNEKLQEWMDSRDRILPVLERGKTIEKKFGLLSSSIQEINECSDLVKGLEGQTFIPENGVYDKNHPNKELQKQCKESFQAIETDWKRALYNLNKAKPYIEGIHSRAQRLVIGSGDDCVTTQEECIVRSRYHMNAAYDRIATSSLSIYDLSFEVHNFQETFSCINRKLRDVKNKIKELEDFLEDIYIDLIDHYYHY